MKRTKHIQKLGQQTQIRLALYLGIFLLLLAIPLTILPSQKRQVFQPLAANTSPSFFCEGSHNGICATPSTPSTVTSGPTAILTPPIASPTQTSSLPTISPTQQTPTPALSPTPCTTTQSVTASIGHHRQSSADLPGGLLNQLLNLIEQLLALIAKLLGIPLTTPTPPATTPTPSVTPPTIPQPSGASPLPPCPTNAPITTTAPVTTNPTGIPGTVNPTAPVQITGAPTSGNFAKVCGTQICINGQPFRIHSATAYHEYDNAATEIAHAKQLKLNTLELVNYDNLNQVDNYLQLAQANGLHIILHLAGFGHAHGDSTDLNVWKPYFDTITSKYSTNATIIMLEIEGEMPNSPADKPFFQAALAYLRSKDPNHILSTGGIGNIDIAGPLQNDWKAIMDDPNNQVCAVEVNSTGEETISAPQVRDYCGSKGKPWFLAAWSSCTGGGDYNHRGSATAVNDHAVAMYNLAKTAIGTSFWNLSTNPAEDCSPNDPNSLFFKTVVNNAP